MSKSVNNISKQHRLIKVGAFCALGATSALFTAGDLASAQAATKTTTGTKTYVGSKAQTQYGPVEVKITVTNGKITKVATPIYPINTPRDQQINSQAIPMLQQEVIKAQGSNIQGIGGASYTSQGFYTSLLSALAKAGLK
jgi:uncharacterized protein with FMN-binding domain